MLDSFPIKFKEGETAATPAGEDLFGQKSSIDKKLPQDKAEAFHTTVAQGLFLTKRGRPDIHTGITFLCTRVQQPNEEDWEKLMRLMKYMNGASTVTCQQAMSLVPIRNHTNSQGGKHEAKQIMTEG